MKVAWAFESYYDLWDSPAIPKPAKQAKLASRSRLGDIFQPGPKPSDPFNPRSYILPHKNHSHIKNNGWYKDIDYTGRNGRRAALLTGDVSHSYLWERPSLFYQFQLHRGQKKSALNDLLQHLEEWPVL